MSKKTKRGGLEGSEAEEEEDSTAVEATAKAEETDEEEESTRTRDLVSHWSKYHGPTRDFTSKRRWRGEHGGAQYRRDKGKKLKNVKVDPLKLEETPFTDGAFRREQPRIDETLVESLTDYVDKSLKELQSINENAIVWTVQEFTDWNQKEGPRVMRLKAENVKGWRKAEREYRRLKRNWNEIADPLKEEYLVNKQLTHALVVGLKFEPYSDAEVERIKKEETKLEKAYEKKGERTKRFLEKQEKEFDKRMLEKEKDSANTSYLVRSKKQDKGSCTLYDNFKQEHPTEAVAAFEKDWGGRFLARCDYRTKGGDRRQTELQVQPAFIFQHFGPEMADMLVREAHLDADSTVKGFYSVYDETMPKTAPTTITLDDTDITHVKYFKPLPEDKKGKGKKKHPVMDEEGFYGMNQKSPGRFVKLTYDWVASNCSPAFTDNLMRKYTKGGFCEIPPGDAKAEEDKAALPLSVKNWLESHSPETLQYGQGDSQTCIYTSFANALHYLGLHDKAAQMIASKEDFLKSQMGGTTTPLKGLPSYLDNLGLGWLQPKSISNFSMEQIIGLTQKQLLVGSLHASDGSCNHAVTVFNGLVFDSNERTCLPLLEDTLDYLVSTKQNTAKFQYMKKGYVFTEHKKKRSKITKLLELKKKDKAVGP